MGLTKLLQWEKSTDGRDLWSAYKNGWKLEVEQDSDGDWVWRCSNWEDQYSIHEAMGTSKTREEAESHAQKWPGPRPWRSA